MKFQAEQTKLKHTLSRISNVIESRNTIPILAHVKLEVSGSTATLTATDLDVKLKINIDVDGHKDGVTTVNAALLKALIEKLPPEKQITFTLDGDLKVKSGNSNFKLKTLSADDYPDIDAGQFTSKIELSADEFKNAIDRTIWASSTEETRYYLNGIALQHKEGQAVFVSTDGHRLARYNSVDASQFPDIIIPSKTAKLLKGVLDGGEAVLEISDSKIRVSTKDTVITSKVIDGTYPDWSRIIPTSNHNSVTAKSAEVKEAIERVSVVSTERTKAVKLTVSGGVVAFDVQDPNMGDGHETVDVEQNGDDVVIGLNSKYALDAMAQADKGSVTVKYGGNTSPLLVEYDKEPGLLCVVMPMRVQ